MLLPQLLVVQGQMRSQIESDLRLILGTCRWLGWKHHKICLMCWYMVYLAHFATLWVYSSHRLLTYMVSANPLTVNPGRVDEALFSNPTMLACPVTANVSLSYSYPLL
jgi:hypothetical protein